MLVRWVREAQTASSRALRATPDDGVRGYMNNYHVLYAVPSLAVAFEAEWTSVMPGSC